MDNLKEECLIETADGPIRGYIDTTEEGTYYKFKKIPYAKPPLGSSRFRPPCPVDPWTDPIDCTQDAPLPLSYFLNSDLLGSEDCLYIEVATKNIKPEKPLPVMFWIGTYVCAGSMDNLLDPTLLLDRDVIFVRCGFRLGPFGFLSINEFSAPGNCGLKDLVLALKWVQNNISRFGGDPDNVTIFGSSAGGSAIHFLMLSPMGTGLFHKGIIQSSSALSNWSLAKNPSQPAMELCKRLGITHTDKLEAIEQLKSVPAEDIMTAFYKLQMEMNEFEKTDVFDAYFKPCIEEDLEGLPAFLTKNPILILKSGNFNKVPIIIGSNCVEGSILEYINKKFYCDFQKYNENVCLLVPRSLSCQDSKLSKTIGRQLLQFYLGVGNNESFNEDTKKQYIQLISDYYFLYYVNKTVRLHSEIAPESPIFYYIVNCAGEWSVPDKLSFLSNLGHSSEIPFLFRIKSAGSICKGTRDSILTRNRVVKMWTNFAKYGNPTPDEDDPLLQIKWDPIENQSKLNYLSIGMELTKGRNPFHDRMVFWERLHKEYTMLRMLVHFNDIGVSW